MMITMQHEIERQRASDDGSDIGQATDPLFLESGRTSGVGPVARGEWPVVVTAELGQGLPTRLEQVREITESWLTEYNEERPHDSLGRVPPLTF